MVIFKNLQASAPLQQQASKLLRRHLGQKLSVLQLQQAFDDKAYLSKAWEAKIMALLFNRSKIAVPSLIIEDMIGTQKNANTWKMGNKFCKPQRCMANVLKHGVLDKRHNWTVPDTCTPIGGKTSKVPREVYKASEGSHSMDWNGMVSTSSSAPWYSPKPENWSVNVADLQLLEDSFDASDLSMI